MNTPADPGIEQMLFFLDERDDDLCRDAASTMRELRTRVQIEQSSHVGEGVREAARKVLSFREGDLPSKGWLRDSNASRAALADLAAALANPPLAPKRTMTIDLTEREQEALERLMTEQELSGPKLFMVALRHYQHDLARIKDGETVTWSGDAQRAREFAGPLALAPVGDVREALEAVAADLRLNEQGGFIATDLHEMTIAKVLAALQSSPSSQVLAPGYVLVPVEPTEAMIDAGRKAQDDGSVFYVEDVYEAMLSAAVEKRND